jgi:hypothetical protein
MSNELLYVGIGAAAVYLFARARKAAPADAVPAKAPSVVPGVTPGTTPGIAQPQGLDASGNIVFGAEGSAMVDKPAVHKINPVDVDAMVAAIQTYARNNNISPEQSYERYLDIYVNGNDTANVALVEAAWQKINSPVVKAGVGMAAVVVVAAGIYYFIANR